MAKWLQVERFRTVGDSIPAGYILDLSYFVVKRSELIRTGLIDELDYTENHQEHNNCVNLHFMSGHSVMGGRANKTRYQLIKEVSDQFEKDYGYRLWINKDLNDTLI